MEVSSREDLNFVFILQSLYHYTMTVVGSELSRQVLALSNFS